MKNDLRSAYSGGVDTATAKPSKDEETNIHKTAIEMISAATPSKNTTQTGEFMVVIVPWVTFTNDEEGGSTSVKRSDIVGVKIALAGKKYTRVINVQRINPNLLNIGVFAANVETYERDDEFGFGVASVTPVISKLTTNQILLMGGNTIKL